MRHPADIIWDAITGRPISDQERLAVALAIEEWANAQGKVSFDQAVGLAATWGGVSPARASALALRNDLLRYLWREEPPYRNLPASAAARVIAGEASRYLSDRWPRERTHVDAPAAEPAATFWRILAAGLPIPQSKQLTRILEEDIQEAV